ncbi:MAG: hypothetical protein QXE25_02570 [Nitrososphaerota archaeon]
MNEYIVVLGTVLIVLCNLFVYLLAGLAGKRVYGQNPKCEPFMGGEENIPPRGHYRSELFIFATLFLVTESYVLALAGSYLSPSIDNVLLYLMGGAAVVLISVLWLVRAGGVRM